MDLYTFLLHSTLLLAGVLIPPLSTHVALASSYHFISLKIRMLSLAAFSDVTDIDSDNE